MGVSGPDLRKLWFRLGSHGRCRDTLDTRSLHEDRKNKGREFRLVRGQFPNGDYRRNRGSKNSKER